MDDGGGGAAGVWGGAAGLGVDGCEGGRVTESLNAGLDYRLGSLRLMLP